MKKKLCIKVCADCEKCMKKAMQLAAVANGVISVAKEGEEKIVVIGDGIDAVSLVGTLRKKTCYANLEAFEEVKPSTTVDQKKPQVDEKSVQVSSVSYEQPQWPAIYDSYGPTPGCSIM